MYREIFGRVIFPMADRITGTHISPLLKSLEKSQWLPEREMREIQEKRLRALVSFSYREVPYYRRAMKERGLLPEDIRTLSDLGRLPVLRKSDVQRSSDELRPVNYDGRVLKWSSGGSTGRPVQFLRGLDDYSQAWAAAFRGWGWAGYRPGDSIVNLWGSPITLIASRNVKKKVQNSLLRRHTLSAYNMTGEALAQYTRFIRSHRPMFIRGYAQAIYVLAEFVTTHGIEGISPSAILTTAETLFPDQRRYIEDVFGCKVFDGYGGGEAPSAAYECEEHAGYHCTAENLIIEVSRDEEPCGPGEEGHILVTNLHSYAMPFIRYDMEDIGTLAGEPCSCGRGLPLLESLEGRVNDMVRTPEGKIVHSYLFPAVFRDLPGVRQFQVVQVSPGAIHVRIVPSGDRDMPDADAIVTSLQRVIGTSLAVRVEFVDEIPPLPGSGKRRFVVSQADATDLPRP